jgi:hypothetical protein
MSKSRGVRGQVAGVGEIGVLICEVGREFRRADEVDAKSDGRKR